MTIVGITGGTGAGKTTVLRVLEENGALILDCDAIYHDLLLNCNEMKQEIFSAFGDVSENDGRIDRKKLGSVVFKDADRLSKLNEITHKYVGMAVESAIEHHKKNRGTLVGIDAIMLIESGLGKKCDVIIGVIAPEDVRLERIVKRENISREYAASRIKAQKPERFFRENCDIIIENPGNDKDVFRKEVCKALEPILKGSSMNV